MGITYIGCMCGNDFLDLATLLKVRMFNAKCAGVCAHVHECVSEWFSRCYYQKGCHFFLLASVQ